MSLDAGYVRGCDPVGSPTGGNCLQSKATPLHELLHRVQYKYTGFSEEQATASNFAVEGHAKFMEDEVFTGLDNASGTQYQLRSNSYLRVLDTPNKLGTLMHHRRRLPKTRSRS